MARVKLTEYDAKRLLFPSLKQSFTGFSANIKTTAKELATFFPQSNLVVKVDQGIKKRGKRGLVRVNVTPKEVVTAIQSWGVDGWQHFLVEPVFEHAPEAEHYLALERMRGGWQVSYSDRGGIEVESSWDSVQRTLLSPQGQALTGSPSNARAGTPKVEGLALLELVPLISSLEKYHIVFLECNPILIRESHIIPLDMAAEIDDTALNLPELAPLNIVPFEEEGKSPVEKDIALLDASTPASLKFKLLDRGGSIWVLLSGGGASLVIADEIADQGMGKNLANYGEYSGAPTDDDVYAYTRMIISALLQAPSRKPRAIIIAGGVANFTDIAKTFRGLIRALDEQKSALLKAGVKIFVRRGGPSELKGLSMMKEFLTQSGLLGSVHGHDTALTQIVNEVKQYLGTPAGPGLAGPKYLPARPGPNGQQI